MATIFCFAGNRYIPGVKEGVTNKGGSSFVADPFTGGSAYVSGLCPQPSTSIGKFSYLLMPMWLNLSRA